MAIILNDNIKVQAPKPSEYRYFHPDNRPWLSVAEVNSTIPLTERHKGLVVFVVDTKYIYKDSIADTDLILDNDGGNQDLQSVLENGEVTTIRPEFEDGITTNKIFNSDGDDFIIPQDEPGDRIIATREWVAENAPSGASTFTDLTDTPSTYTGQSGKKVVVNAGETALEFVEDDSAPTQTSDLTNDGADGTSTYVETDELGAVAFSNNYNDLDGLPTIPSAYVHPNHSGDVTSVGDGVQTITNQAVTNTKFRNSTEHTVVGRAGSGSGSVADITLGNDTILGRQGSNNVEGLSVSQVQSILSFSNKQNIPETKTTSFTAVNNEFYIVNNTATITLPTGVEGKGFIFEVTKGTTTIGADTFAVNSFVNAKFVDGTWKYLVLRKGIDISPDTVIAFDYLSAMSYVNFLSITTRPDTFYFTEEQNASGWQTLTSEGDIVATAGETQITYADGVSNGDSSFTLIDLSNAKINGIFEKDFMLVGFKAGVVTPATTGQYFKIILKINGIEEAVSPVFYLVESASTVEQISFDFGINVTADMVTNGAYLYVKTSATITFENPSVSAVRVHKSNNATE